LRDAEVADIELRESLTARDADAALLFTGTGRGTSLFDEPDHDADVVAQLFDDPPTAGFFTAGEFAPLHGLNFVHGFTASIALFSEQQPT
jgi:small ligand-binding sensory domain FIST